MPIREHEQTIAALLERETALRSWLEQIRGLARDPQGRTVVVGLSLEETEEFLRLHPIVRSPENGLTQANSQQARERYAELKTRLETALQDDAVESLSSWGEASARA